MFLKRLEINGFKSFVHKTRLDFSLNKENKKNITAIVGPNGSGKSNLADALRWVLGEQSFKLLRIKKTEDVIFAGFGKYSRLGSAFVSVILDNEDGRIPLDYKEIIISRRFSRNGESEYLINRKKVKLSDLIELTAQGGIGRHGYAVVGQGMADSILLSSASERKAILEEAAGVKQYQLKKEQALKKLEATKRNSLRVLDLLSEITPRLRSLKRQANKAKKKEEIEKELKAKQNIWYGFYWKNLTDRYSKLLQEENKVKEQIFYFEEEIKKVEKNIQKEKEKNQDSQQMNLKFSKELETLFNRRNDLQRDLALNEGRLEAQKEVEISTLEEKNSSNKSIDLNFIKRQLEKLNSDYENFLILFKKAEKKKNWLEAKNLFKKIGESLKSIIKEINPKFRSKDFISRGNLTVSSGAFKGRGVKFGSSHRSQYLESQEKIRIKKDSSQREKIKEELIEKISQIKIKLEIKEGEIKKLQTKIYEMNEKEKSAREKFFDFENNLRQKQNGLEKFKNELNKIEIEKAKIETNKENLENEIKKELGNLSCLEYYEKTADSEFDKERLKERIDKLKAEIFSIGGIDSMVIQEYKETEERYNFLSDQLKDLEKASVSLKHIIAELEDKIESVFSKTFKEINNGFSEYFRILFNGGTARLQLIKSFNRKKNFEKETEEDELGNFKKRENDEGVEIIAVPPGKRIRNLSMLSGGERTLTSIALLFAIISCNPPPFSMLDEIDAALDEANIYRFAKILEQLSQKTQFIIITHNRETMRQASSLYGVTTIDNGISKIISVKLDNIKKDGKTKNVLTNFE